MENYFKTNLQLLHVALWDDAIDRTLFLISAGLFLIDYAIWSRYLSSPELFVYLKVAVYPVKLLAVMIGINTFLAIVAHEKEKEIGYFLFISSVIVAVLVLILEIFYLINL